MDHADRVVYIHFAIYRKYRGLKKGVVLSQQHRVCRGRLKKYRRTIQKEIRRVGDKTEEKKVKLY